MTVGDTSIPHAKDIAAIYLHIVLGDAAAYHAATLESMPERYTAPVRLRLEMGRYVLAEDYVRAQHGRDPLRREVDAALAGHDVLVLPTLPIPAPPLGVDSVKVGATVEPVQHDAPAHAALHLTGHPAVAIPCGRTSAGLPCSLQIVGAHRQTESLLRAALACEAQIG